MGFEHVLFFYLYILSKNPLTVAFKILQIHAIIRTLRRILFREQRCLVKFGTLIINILHESLQDFADSRNQKKSRKIFGNYCETFLLGTILSLFYYKILIPSFLMKKNNKKQISRFPDFHCHYT